MYPVSANTIRVYQAHYNTSICQIELVDKYIQQYIHQKSNSYIFYGSTIFQMSLLINYIHYLKEVMNYYPSVD